MRGLLEVAPQRLLYSGGARLEWLLDQYIDALMDGMMNTSQTSILGHVNWPINNKARKKRSTPEVMQKLKSAAGSRETTENEAVDRAFLYSADAALFLAVLLIRWASLDSERSKND